MKGLAGRVVALAFASNGMEIRNAQNAVQVRYHCFCTGAYGVLILNLQPEAGSEGFVRSSSRRGTRSAACGGFVRVGVDVSATIADSAVLYREESREARQFPAAEKDFDTCNQDKAPVQPAAIILSSGLPVWVASTCCVASPRIRREPPCSLSTQTWCYPSLSSQPPPQTPGLDRTATLLRAIAHRRNVRPGHSDIYILSRVMQAQFASIARIVASAPIRWQVANGPHANASMSGCLHRTAGLSSWRAAEGYISLMGHLDSFYTIQRDIARQVQQSQCRACADRQAANFRPLGIGLV